MTGRSYYDDNYGHWDNTEDPDVQAFYHKVAKESVWKKCKGCGRRVKLRPDYAICNACAERADYGFGGY